MADRPGGAPRREQRREQNRRDSPLPPSSGSLGTPLSTPLRTPLGGRLSARRRLGAGRRRDGDTFGIFAESFARFMGTAQFLLYMTLVVVVWIVWNRLAPDAARFDAYPFIFLTLILSLQASYAAPLILLAQNRQEMRDKVIAEQDRQANARAHADMEFLAREVASLRMAVGEVATRDFVRSELRSLLADLDGLDRRRETESDEPRQRP